MFNDNPRETTQLFDMQIVSHGLESWFVTCKEKSLSVKANIIQAMILFCSVMPRGTVSAFSHKSKTRTNRCGSQLRHLGEYSGQTCGT